MASFPDPPNDFYAGDALTINPDVPVSDASVITDAYLTIKVNQDDDDTAAVLRKHITTSVTSAGVITAGTGTVNTRFDLTETDTLLLHPKTNPTAFASLGSFGYLRGEIAVVDNTGNPYRAQFPIRAGKGYRLLDAV